MVGSEETGRRTLSTMISSSIVMRPVEACVSASYHEGTTRCIHSSLKSSSLRPFERCWLECPKSGRRTGSEVGGFDGRGHVQRKVKRSPGAASATRCRNSRSYTEVERQTIDRETGTGIGLTMFSRVGWSWARSAGSSLSTTTSSARYPYVPVVQIETITNE
jgi:hypothetical protein